MTQKHDTKAWHKRMKQKHDTKAWPFICITLKSMTYRDFAYLKILKPSQPQDLLWTSARKYVNCTILILKILDTQLNNCVF